MKIQVIDKGQHVATIDRKAFPYGRRKRAVNYKGTKYGVRKFGGRHFIYLDQPINAPLFGVGRNPLGVPWWVLVGGAAAVLYVATRIPKTAGGLTTADLEKTVTAKMLGKATNVTATVAADGSVVVKGKYGGNTEFTFIKASSLTAAFASAQKLSGETPSIGVSGIGSVGLGYFGCPGCR